MTTSLEAVRLKTSDKSIITREIAKGDAASKYFKLKESNINASPAIEVRVAGGLLVVTTDYTLNAAQGIVTFNTAPALQADIEFTYYWSVFSDTEMQFFLDEAGDNTTIAAARCLLAWAADAAKLAKRQTLSGGGGLGQTVIDTSVIAKELRATAKAMIDTEKDLGESIPAEGLTEVPWTEAMYQRQLDQHTIRDG